MVAHMEGQLGHFGSSTSALPVVVLKIGVLGLDIAALL